MTIFLAVASLFEDVGFVRPSGQDHLIVLSKFLVRKDGSATEESLASLERILTEVRKIKIVIFWFIFFMKTFLF